MRNRAVLVLLAPAILAAVGCAIAWTRPREQAARRSGRPRGRSHLWTLTLLGALVGLVGGALVGMATGRATGHPDLWRDAVDGSFLLVPGMLVGLAAGLARALTIKVVSRPRRRLRWRRSGGRPRR